MPARHLTRLRLSAVWAAINLASHWCSGACWLAHSQHLGFMRFATFSCELGRHHSQMFQIRCGGRHCWVKCSAIDMCQPHWLGLMPSYTITISATRIYIYVSIYTPTNGLSPTFNGEPDHERHNCLFVCVCVIMNNRLRTHRYIVTKLA